MGFGEKLKEQREKHEMTQKQLAELLHVSRQAVTRWENGDGYPSVDNLKYISRYFNVTIDYLVNDEATAPEVEPEETGEQAEQKPVTQRRKAVLMKLLLAVFVVAALIGLLALMATWQNKGDERIYTFEDMMVKDDDGDADAYFSF